MQQFARFVKAGCSQAFQSHVFVLSVDVRGRWPQEPERRSPAHTNAGDGLSLECAMQFKRTKEEEDEDKGLGGLQLIVGSTLA